MQAESFPGLSIGALPDRAELLRLLRAGTLDVINVSGVDLRHVHGLAVPSGLRIAEFGFPDLFSREDGDSEAWQLFHATHGARIEQATCHLAAVLTSGRPVHCCCHQGRFRSPLVAAAGLMRAFALRVQDAMDIISAKHPKASFTPRSRWMLDRLATGGKPHAQSA